MLNFIPSTSVVFVVWDYRGLCHFHVQGRWSMYLLNIGKGLLAYTAGMSSFKQVVIDFLVSKLPVIYHLLLSYLTLSKNIGKNNMTHNVCCKSNIHWKYRPLSLQNLNIIMLYYTWIYMLFTYNFLVDLWDRPNIDWSIAIDTLDMPAIQHYVLEYGNLHSPHLISHFMRFLFKGFQGLSLVSFVWNSLKPSHLLNFFFFYLEMRAMIWNLCLAVGCWP
jgi:hypothetical protein